LSGADHCVLSGWRFLGLSRRIFGGGVWGSGWLIGSGGRCRRRRGDWRRHHRRRFARGISLATRIALLLQQPLQLSALLRLGVAHVKYGAAADQEQQQRDAAGKLQNWWRQPV